MKKIAIIALTVAIASSAAAQGIVRFQNRVSGVFITPIYGVNPNDPLTQMTGHASTNGGSRDYTGVPLLAGTGFSAALFAAPVGDGQSVNTAAYQQLFADARFSTSATLPGVFVGNNAVTVPGAAGVPWNFQVRAWNNAGGTIVSWAAVLAAEGTANEVANGVSDIFSMTPAVSPTPQPNMTAMTSFNLVAPVPEPSLIALGALGLGALLLRRRKA